MKKSKFLILPLLGFFLAGCSSSSIKGEYVFQLGKDKGTHFGIYLNLTDDLAYNEEQELLGKKYTLDFALQGMAPENGGAAELFAAKDLGNNIKKAAEPSYDPSKADNDFALEGYYVHNPDLKNLDSEGNEIIPIGITKLVDKEDGSSADIPISEELVEKILYSTISDSTFTLVIPVSFEDILLQIYWYGYDIRTLSLVTPHKVGSNPSQAEIDEINKTYPDSHGGEKFRAFHKLHMGLTKI